jgi:hypothetical protein
MPGSSRILPPWLAASSDSPDSHNVYQLRADLAGRVLLWIAGGIAFTLLAGVVVVGLFAPSLLWIVPVVGVVLVVAGGADVAFIIYCHYRSYRVYGPGQQHEEQVVGSLPDQSSMAEGTVVSITEEKPGDTNT